MLLYRSSAGDVIRVTTTTSLGWGNKHQTATPRPPWSSATPAKATGRGRKGALTSLPGFSCKSNAARGSVRMRHTVGVWRMLMCGRCIRYNLVFCCLLIKNTSWILETLFTLLIFLILGLTSLSFWRNTL